MPQVKICKGSILSARVYADVKNNKCSCEGSFTKRIPHDDEPLIKLPACSDCGKLPPFFVIDADTKDANGNRVKVRIRNTKDSERLDSKTRVAYIFNVIQKEILGGTFNIRHYDSEASKKSFFFKNYVAEYLEHQARKLTRGEITNKGLKDKEGLVRRELMPVFGKIELFRITPAMINKFRDKYTDRFRTRDLALGELKTILNQAERDGLLTNAPKFDPIPRANIRQDIISLELAWKTVEHIDIQLYQDMYTLLLTYPIRPGELRALMWKDVDLKGGKFTICQHFTDETLIEGRKSIKKGKPLASIPFDMNPTAREVFSKYRPDITPLNSYVFPGMRGGFVTESCLYHSWLRARKILKHSYAPYECRHVAAAQLYKRTGNDIVRTKKVGGWTNLATVERYVTDSSDNSGLFD